MRIPLPSAYASQTDLSLARIPLRQTMNRMLINGFRGIRLNNAVGLFSPLNTPRFISGVSYNSLASSIRLNTLPSVPGSRKKAVRVGRGRASGKGKTCGKGQKGQKTRSGVRRKLGLGFQGGQMPFHRRFPKFGFTRTIAPDYERLNLSTLREFIEEGKLDASRPITVKDIADSKIVGKIKEGVKLLGRGCEDFNVPVTIHVTTASKQAVEAVERAGGKVVYRYYNKLGLRALIQPHKFDVVPRFCRPPLKWLEKHYPNGDYVRQRNEVEHGGYPCEDDLEPVSQTQST